MKKIVILFLYFFILFFAKMIKSEENNIKDIDKITIYCSSWTVIDGENRNPFSLINDISVFKIDISNNNLIQGFEKILKNKKEQILEEKLQYNPNYRMSVICYTHTNIDTISFNQNFKFMKINNIYYEFDWGLFLYILIKVPSYYRNSIEYLITTQYN